MNQLELHLDPNSREQPHIVYSPMKPYETHFQSCNDMHTTRYDQGCPFLVPYEYITWYKMFVKLDMAQNSVHGKTWDLDCSTLANRST